MPGSLLDSGRALAVHIYDLSMNVTGGDASAYASALVLVVLILAINALALGIGERWLARRVTIDG
jgi:phosphate transport system permease protein